MGRVADWLFRLLGAVPPNEMAGAQLEGPIWEVAYEGVDHAAFIRHLPTLVQDGGVLVLEGGSPGEGLQAFLNDHALPAEVAVARGTIRPRAGVVHLPISERIMSALAGHAEHAAYPELCIHLHAYAAGRLVMQWYDAFSAPCWLSQEIPEVQVRAFCSEVQTSFKAVPAL